ncbi:MAG: HAMP domain-containing sensor histidine kinase [Cyclobacteriaceae bacterium]
MKKLWRAISSNGVATVTDPGELQSLVITNRVSFIATILVLMVGALLGARQWNAEPIFIFSSAIIFVSVFWLVHVKYYSMARVLICLSVPLIIVGMSVISKKIPGEEITESEFFDYRFVLIGASVVPPLVFGFSRFKLLASCLLVYLLAFILFDPIHNLFGVGYYQIEHVLPSYQISQWISTIMFCAVAAGVLVLRKTSDEIQRKNIELIHSLNVSNTLLEERTRDLENAHVRIKTQNKELNRINDRLAEKVDAANSDLAKTNAELVRHNSELQQYSYIVSHNLRGPVASLLGLVNLVKHEEVISNHPVFEHIRKASKALDGTVRDLGMIVDVRNDIYKIKQSVSVPELLSEVITPFQREILEYKIKLSYDIKSEELYTIRPMLTSIVHNLVSNSIKYRANDRTPHIEICTRTEDGNFVLMVKDNGIGLNVEANRQDIFKLYKRFNTHTEGKGIGLYLVSLQVNSLGGSIEVRSEVDVYTEFVVSLPPTANANHQLIWKESYAEIYFNAPMNLIGLKWKSDVTGEEFRGTLERSVSCMREYNALHWLMDIRDRGNVSDEDQLWLLDSFLPTVFKLGLKRLALVYSGELNPSTVMFYEKNTAVFLKYDIQIYFTRSADEAHQWLEEEKLALVRN